MHGRNRCREVSRGPVPQVIRGWIALAGLVFVGGILYATGALIANNASFFNPPGALERLNVYLSLSKAWTQGGYPLPEVSSRDYMGNPALVRQDILRGIRHFSRWNILSSTPGATSGPVERIRISIPASFWQTGQTMELVLTRTPYGIHLESRSESVRRIPDCGANRNSILRMFHAIDNEMAIHPPA